MWLALVVVGATHALIFLPVALSFFGGDGYFSGNGYGGLEEDLHSRAYRTREPANYDEDTSDEEES